MTNLQGDLVVTALSALVPGGVVRRELRRTDGRRLGWVEAGPADAPAVVLAHGAGDTVLDWATVLPALAKQFRVIAYDRAGLGASDPIRRLTTTSQVDDLIALLDTIGPAILVGHSWGGLLVQLAAGTRPGSVRGLVLVDPTHEDVMAEVPLKLRLASDLMLSAIVVRKAVGLLGNRIAKGGRDLAVLCGDDPEIQDLVDGAYRASYARFHHVAAIRAENRLAAGRPEAIRLAREAAPAPDVPMRILTATRGKPPALQVLSADLAARTAAAYPRGEHIVVADAGHYIQFDQPAAVVAAISLPEPPQLSR